MQGRIPIKIVRKICMGDRPTFRLLQDTQASYTRFRGPPFLVVVLRSTSIPQRRQATVQWCQTHFTVYFRGDSKMRCSRSTGERRCQREGKLDKRKPRIKCGKLAWQSRVFRLNSSAPSARRVWSGSNSD